ncbi:MAG TPA: hypothetical protein VMR17_22985 [Xanthobacteraceae bacterium]|jgi:hypothetical protein|nr:hypothetical protein [Xanthobacteraceae bacterium]
MSHPGAGAVRQHIASPRARRRLQKTGNANAVVTRNRDRLGNRS